MAPVLPDQARDVSALLRQLVDLALAQHNSNFHEGQSDPELAFCPGCSALRNLQKAVPYRMLVQKGRTDEPELKFKDTSELPGNAVTRLNNFQAGTPGSAGLIAQLRARLGI